MKILLDGYFDNNFGDDYMIKIIVRCFPEWEFFIKHSNNISPVITDENNVYICENEVAYPKLIIIGSGFMINSFASLQCEIKWFFQRKHIGDYCIGCNIEPLSNKIKEYLIKKKLQKFKMIACRDRYSYKWLKANCKETKIYYLPDILFSMPDEWICNTGDKTKLGISILHRSNDNPDCLYYRVMAQAADYWIEKTNEVVYLLAFNTGNEDDVYACQCVKSKMRHSNKAKIIKHGNKGEIIEAYSECKKIIGARFHSAVLAMKMGIDFFPVIYREKMRNLICDMSYPEAGCYIDDVKLPQIKHFIDAEEICYKLKESVTVEARQYYNIIKENIT